ncbi:hypothetical protein AAFF_G00331640 [Aldrovandia affinis]|uniref:Uncharacterized protein n=1 Tax=Aldrovandia affinis TaxID=143900 RepID=A0AAD7SLC3_9TELE|nr:hypothetical protein AAFF_G00331640 [Aldrovandia affinis]
MKGPLPPRPPGPPCIPDGEAPYRARWRSGPPPTELRLPLCWDGSDESLTDLRECAWVIRKRRWSLLAFQHQDSVGETVTVWCFKAHCPTVFIATA